MNWNFLYHSYERRDFCKRLSGVVVKTVGGLYVVEKAADIVSAGPPPPVLRLRVSVQKRTVVSAVEPSEYLINQNFETPTTGYDNGEAWTPTGSVSFNTSTPLLGSQDLQIGTGTNNIYSPAFTPQSTIWSRVVFKTSGVPAAAIYFLSIRDVSDNQLAALRLSVAGAILVYCGTANITSTLTLAGGEVYYFWLKYIAGTGSNGVCAFYFSVTDTRPANPDKTITNGSSTADAVNVRLANGASNQTFNFDGVIASTTELA